MAYRALGLQLPRETAVWRQLGAMGGDSGPRRRMCVSPARRVLRRLATGVLLALATDLVLVGPSSAQLTPQGPISVSPSSPEMVPAHGIGQVTVHWSGASCANPSGAELKYWSWRVRVAINHEDGTHAEGNSKVYIGVTAWGSDQLTFTLQMKDGLQTETFSVRVVLECNIEQTTIGTQSITLKRTKPCDPSLFDKAQREFDIAKSFYEAGSKELKDAADSIRVFRNEYAKESLKIGAEKLTALDILHTLSETAFEAAEVTGLYVGILVIIEEIALKFIPLAQEHARLTNGAHGDFQRGDMWAARATSDLQKALAGGPCLGPIERQLKKLLDEQRLADQARALIETWDNNGYNYLSPITGEVVSEDAALKQARAALVSGKMVPQEPDGSRGRAAREARDAVMRLASHRAIFAAQPKIKATAAQVRAALGYINAALATHRRAADQVARLYAASTRTEKQLNRLLKAWPP